MDRAKAFNVRYNEIKAVSDLAEKIRLNPHYNPPSPSPEFDLMEKATALQKKRHEITLQWQQDSFDRLKLQGVDPNYRNIDDPNAGR